jgi:hypothetical protein
LAPGRSLIPSEPRRSSLITLFAKTFLSCALIPAGIKAELRVRKSNRNPRLLPSAWRWAHTTTGR